METTKAILFGSFGFLICFLMMRTCEPKPKTVTKIEYKGTVEKIPYPVYTKGTNTITEIKGDTEIHYIDTSKTDEEIQRIIDSVSVQILARITQKYYNVNFYRDSIFIDTIGYVVVNDSIQKNLIKNRKLEYFITAPVLQPKKERGYLSAGVMVGGNKNSFDLGIGGSFTTKNRLSIGYDYNIIDNAHYLRLSKNIFRRR